jgi:hypothetical protein
MDLFMSAITIVDVPILLIFRFIFNDVIRHLQKLFLFISLLLGRGLTNSAMNPKSSFDPTPSIRPGEAALDACPTTPSIRRVNRAT